MKKSIWLIIAYVLIILAFICIVTLAISFVKAEELTEAWVICQDYVNVRMSPSRKSESVGYVDAGDKVLVSDKKKNGFLKCYGIGEYGEGWIHSGYIVYDRPEKVNCKAYSVSRGKLRARRHIGGKRLHWIKHFEEVKVYWISENWCVTDKGFVESRFLEMEGA